MFFRSPAVRLTAISLALVFVGEACSGDDDKVSTATTTTTTSSTTTSSTTSTTLKPAPAGLGVGSKGPEVAALHARLKELHYDVQSGGETFGSHTQQAVMAFQKTNDLPRTGRATDDVITKLNTAGNPAPLLASGGSSRIEVDLRRQVLFLYKGGALDRIVAISTGNNKRYCVDGSCAKAVTPGGSFRITRRINGWRTSRLGQLWNPMYFNGGIAIHGAASVPASPASHGCVRVPMWSANWLFREVPNGTPVYVIGGPKAPVPFNEPAPGDAPPETTTTTTAPTTTSSTTSSTTTSTTTP